MNRLAPSDSIKRGRTGCWGCKARRRKCTEEKPSCIFCTSRRINCDYGFRLTWEDEAKHISNSFNQAKKDHVRRNDVGCKRSGLVKHVLLPVSGRALFLNTTVRDIQQFLADYSIPRSSMMQYSIEEPTSESRYWNMDTSLHRHLSVFPSLDEESCLIFSYYEKVFCNRKVFANSSINPFRDLIIPLCIRSSALMNAVIAVSANDLSSTGRNTFLDKSMYGHKLLLHKFRSLRIFSQQLEEYRGSPDTLADVDSGSVADRDSMLLTILMQCHLEIATGSRHEWTLHLRGAISLMAFFQDQIQRPIESIFSSPILQFADHYFYSRYAFLSTTSEEKNHHEFDNWVAQVTSRRAAQSWQDITRINAHIGVSRELLDIISSTTILSRCKHRLRRTRRSGWKDELSFQETARDLQRRLDNLDQWCDGEDENKLAYYNAKAFKEAAYIYLRYGAFDDPIDHPSIQQEYLQKLLRLLEYVCQKQKGSIDKFPVWALFIAGCVVMEEQRSIVLGLFEDLRVYWPIGNVPLTMSAIETIWKTKDLRKAWTDGKEDDSASRVAFEWEDTLTKLGWKMSLS